jgi:hypothetical protein
VTVRARALGAGLALAVVYGVTALWSGHLSPLARRPLLDGLAPPTAYRWVQPPPELAATNQKPTPGTFTVKLGNDGSKTAVFTTDDAQVTVILPAASFANAEGQRSVEVTVEPLAGAIAHPEDPLHVVGNVYLIDATYQPSGDVAKFASVATVVLVYPLLANDHGSHAIIWSKTGEQWKALDTDDLLSIQQAGADMRELGYVSVAGQPASPTADGTSGGGSSVATIAIVAGLIVLAVVAAVLLRKGSRSGSGEASRELEERRRRRQGR